MSLSFEKRKIKILAMLKQEGRVQVRAIAKELQVSDETVRRDLERLDKEGQLKKVYGGAVKIEAKTFELPFEEKRMMNTKEKRAICKQAAELVQEDDIIFIGNWTTPLEIVRFLGNKPKITVITPSLPVLLLALDHFPGKIIFIGGEIDNNQKYTSGPLSENMIRQLKANKAFIAAGGISDVNGVTDYDINGSSISRKMMERSDEVIILADHSKFGETAFSYMCELTDATKLITDKHCPKEWRNIVLKKGIQLYIAE